MGNLLKIKLHYKILLVFLLLIISFEGILFTFIINFGYSISTHPNIKDIGLFTVALLSISGVIYGSIYFFEKIKYLIIKQSMIHIKKKYVANVLYRNEKPETVISFINNDLKLFETNYINSYFSIVQNLALAIVTTVIMFTVQPLIALVFLISSLLNSVPLKIYKHTLHKKADQYKQSVIELNKQMQNTVSGVNVIRQYSVFQYHKNRVFNFINKTDAAYYFMNLQTRFVTLIINLSSMFSFIFPFAIGLLYSAYIQYIPFVVLINFFFLNDRVVSPIKVCFSEYVKIKQVESIVSEIKNEMEYVIPDVVDDIALSRPNVRLENISYCIEDKLLLDNTSLAIPYGKKILITGDSGSGKSTLLKIIANQIKPTIGSVIIHDNNIEFENNIAFYSLIEQSPHLFYDTILNNICFGREMNIHDDIHLLKINKEIDDMYDDNFSGGEKQKITVLRSMYSDRKICLADEMSSALDKESSKIIRRQLFSDDITLIEVAHHYDDEFIYDEIYKLENGKLIRI